MRPARLLVRIRRGDVRNVAFSDLVRLLRALGFQEVGGRGSHRVFAHPKVVELVNVQEEHGAAKPYQVRHVANPCSAIRSQLGGGPVTRAYRTDVSWSDEDNAWVADVPELAYCSAHGPTPHDAVAEVERAIDAWIDAATAAGRPIPEPQPRAVHA